MFKRNAIVLVLGLGIILLSACGGGDLAEDLTPIPTLPDQAEPELRAELQAGPAVAAPASDSGATDEAMSQDDLVAMGEQLFSGVCAGCHSEADGAGPAFTGMADRAAGRVEGQSAEEYLHESIVEPGAYVVEGFGNIMPSYADQYNEQELNALVAYIMAASSEGEGATAESADEGGETEEESDDSEVSGDPAAGETLFGATCAGCHGAEDGAGPALTGIGERAAGRVEGLSAEEYLHQSIVEPGAYVVDGFSNIMPPSYGDQYSDEEINDLVAYLLTQ